MSMVHVLLIEDNPGDADLIKETLESDKLHLKFSLATDGVQALAMLRRAPPFETADRPDLILLDINLPRLSGHEVLAQIKADPGLRDIPVVMLTSSQSESDVRASYEHGANCYVAKPVGLAQFQAIVKSIESFWLTVVRLP